MTNKGILTLLNDNPIFFLATSIDDEPRVRAMRLYRADKRGIIFNTSSSKDLHKQLQANRSVELCFYDHDEGCQVRIRGKVQQVSDAALREQMAQSTPALASIVRADGPDALVVYRLTKGKVNVWQMDEDCTPRLMSNIELSSIWMAMYKGAYDAPASHSLLSGLPYCHRGYHEHNAWRWHKQVF